MKKSTTIADWVWTAHGLPVPTAEHRFCERRWRFDYAWPAEKGGVALEIEGGVWLKKSRHFHGKGAISDMQKYNRATVLGWQLIRCTPADVKSGAIFETLRKVLVEQ